MMINGLGTAIYPVSDLAAAKAWYSKLVGHDPYFDQPFYVGFAVGGFELGLIPDGVPGANGVAAYWRVSDAAAEIARLLALGSSPHESVCEVGGGIKVGSVLDPFGNVFSIIENPHFDPKQVR